MILDFRTQETACNSFLGILGVDSRTFVTQFVDEYDCNLELQLKQYAGRIGQLDLTKDEVILYHIATASDECNRIKQTGLLDLRRVLTEGSELCAFLDQHKIVIDKSFKEIHVNENAYCIDYDAIRRMPSFSIHKQDKLQTIAHKLWIDYPLWAFFYEEGRYSCIQHWPEILENVAQLTPHPEVLLREWSAKRRPYAVSFRATLDQLEDIDLLAHLKKEHNGDIGSFAFKKHLVVLLYERSYNRSKSEWLALLKIGQAIPPEKIIDCRPLDKGTFSA